MTAHRQMFNLVFYFMFAQWNVNKSPSIFGSIERTKPRIWIKERSKRLGATERRRRTIYHVYFRFVELLTAVWLFAENVDCLGAHNEKFITSRSFRKYFSVSSISLVICILYSNVQQNCVSIAVTMKSLSKYLMPLGWNAFNRFDENREHKNFSFHSSPVIFSVREFSYCVYFIQSIHLLSARTGDGDLNFINIFIKF